MALSNRSQLTYSIELLLNPHTRNPSLTHLNTMGLSLGRWQAVQRNRFQLTNFLNFVQIGIAIDYLAT